MPKMIPPLPEPTTLTALAQASVELSELPWGAHAVAGAAVVAGMLLWLMGRRLVKPLYVVATAVLGAAFAFYAPAALGIRADPNIMLGVGALAGALVGFLFFRLTMGLILAAMLGVVAPLVAAGIMQLQPAPETRDAAGSAVSNALDADVSGFDVQQEDIDEAVRAASERVRAFVEQTREVATAEWERLDGDQRRALIGSTLLGIALGLGLGMTFSKQAATLTGAMVGAAIWIPGAAWLLAAFIEPAKGRLPTDPRVWLGIWVGISVLGAALQWTRPKRRADK